MTKFRVTTPVPGSAASGDSPAAAPVAAIAPDEAAYESCGVPWLPVPTRHVARAGSVSFEQEAYLRISTGGRSGNRPLVARQGTGCRRRTARAGDTRRGRHTRQGSAVAHHDHPQHRQRLAASHVIELVFTRPEKFDGGGIDRILQFSTRETRRVGRQPAARHIRPADRDGLHPRTRSGQGSNRNQSEFVEARAVDRCAAALQIGTARDVHTEERAARQPAGRAILR